VMMGQPVGRPYRVVRHFSEDTKAFYVLFDLATIHEPQIEKIINRELQAAGGDAVVNLQLKHQFKFLDLLLRFIAEPFFGSSTVTVEGDVAKFTP